MQEKLPHSGACISGRRIHVQKHCSDIFPFSFSLFGKATDKWLNMSLWEDRVGLLPPESLKYYNSLSVKCTKKMSDRFLIMRYENCKFTLLGLLQSSYNCKRQTWKIYCEKLHLFLFPILVHRLLSFSPKLISSIMIQ